MNVIAGPVTCGRCGHDVGRHWPNTSQQSTTACVTCLDEQATTTAADGRTGICDTSADPIWRDALAARLAAVEALHVCDAVPWVCRTCRTPWPCLTHRALAVRAEPSETTRD